VIDTLKQAVVDHMRSVYSAAAAGCTVVVGKWKRGDDDAFVILNRQQHTAQSPLSTHQHLVTGICHLWYSFDG